MSLRRPDDDDAGHPVGFQEFIQVLLDDSIAAPGSVSHNQALAVTNKNAAVKYVEMFSCGGEKDQISGLQLAAQRADRGFRNTFESCPDGRQTAHDVQYALFDNGSNSREETAYSSDSRVVANPAGHVMIAPFPPNAAFFVANLPQAIDEFIQDRGLRQREHRFHIGHAIETIERCLEDFRRGGRTDESVCSVGTSEELTGKNFDSGA